MEDTHLWLAFGGKRTGTYVDVGAGHPIADNVSFFFYERGWQGVAVEPQQKLVDLYARLRPRDAAVAAVIGTRSGEVDFHDPVDERARIRGSEDEPDDDEERK